MREKQGSLGIVLFGGAKRIRLRTECAIFVSPRSLKEAAMTNKVVARCPRARLKLDRWMGLLPLFALLSTVLMNTYVGMGANPTFDMTHTNDG